MNTNGINYKLIDGYISLLKNMSTPNKLELISKLKSSTKSDIKHKTDDFYKSFGGWDENESAEELINAINESRTFSRSLEEF